MNLDRCILGDGARNGEQAWDTYLAFAKLAGAAPGNATKETHKETRKLFKECVLATQYCIGAESLATRIGKAVAEARELLEMHKKTFRVFWIWSDRILEHLGVRSVPG